MLQGNVRLDGETTRPYQVVGGRVGVMTTGDTLGALIALSFLTNGDDAFSGGAYGRRRVVFGGVYF